MKPVILVVDDESAFRKALRFSLEPAYDVVDAADGRSALQTISAKHVDLVLLDVRMPEVDGLEACRKIKQTRSDEFLPVLLLTAYSAREDRMAGLEAGADDFLAKPIGRDELLLRVRLFLRLREQERIIRRQVEELQKFQSLKEDLVSMIIHDLRNPLTGIEGHIDLVERELERGDLAGAQSDLAGAKEASRRLREILEDVLQVQSLEEQPTLRRERLSVRALIRESMISIQGAARARGVRVELIEGEDLVLSIDRKLFVRSLENLLSNAVRYSPQGESVEISCRSAGNLACLQIADRGPGIPQGHRTDLFRKFKSMEGPGSARRGIGLGLYLVKLVAQAHGGDISVRDREGSGSVFRLDLPV
jgi:signal transduction histidine kinase